MIREKEPNENYVEQVKAIRGMVTFANKDAAEDFVKQANKMELSDMTVRARIWRGQGDGALKSSVVTSMSINDNYD